VIEIPAIAAALAGIKNATDIAKMIKDSGATLKEAEINLKLADLIGSLADTKMEVANIRNLLTEREEEIRRLNEELRVKGGMVYEAPYYFLQTETGRDGPFCQKCYDSNNKIIRLQMPGRQGYWECHECKSGYKDKDYDHGDSGIRVVSRRRSIDWGAY
jgi:hypothetical protein